MQFKLPTTNDLDEWLTNLPEDYLQRLTRTTDQVLQDNVQDQKALTHIVALILHFCGKPALRVEEIMDLFPHFALLLALETLLRQGAVTKQDKYSIVEGEEGATFAMAKRENTGNNQ